MDRADYPALAESQLIHLDASAAMPLHWQVVEAIQQATLICGAPGKASYRGAGQATQLTQAARQAVADLVGAAPGQIFFVPSASHAAAWLARTYGPTGPVAYAPEDHSTVVAAIRAAVPTGRRIELTYGETGEYVADADTLRPVASLFANHIHHLYGTDNDLVQLRQLCQGRLFVDLSQSVARLPVDVGRLGCDGAFFSGQKLGGITGVGVLYLRQPAPAGAEPLEPATLPLVPIAALGAAARVLRRHTMARVAGDLARKTSHLVTTLAELPGLHFSKGIALADERCSGNGIVSFWVDGYDSVDIAQLLDDHKIAVRAGDHCIGRSAAAHDAVRVSLYTYTSQADLDRLRQVLSLL